MPESCFYRFYIILIQELWVTEVNFSSLRYKAAIHQPVPPDSFFLTLHNYFLVNPDHKAELCFFNLNTRNIYFG